jgi:hypothetical protein
LQQTPWAYPDDGEGETLDKWSQGAQVGTKQRGKHVDTSVNEVDGRSARRSFRIHRIVGMDEVRHVGNVYDSASGPHEDSVAPLTDTSFNIAVGQLLRMQSIVNILAT